MAKFTRRELERAWANYVRLRDEASQTGDWTIWSDQFTEDARYVEHAYGEFRGRNAIRDWIVQVMKPFPHMKFPHDWYVIDQSRGWVLFQCINSLDHPSDAHGRPFVFPTWSLLVYAGDLKWSLKEDMYNPETASKTVQAWLEARRAAR